MEKNTFDKNHSEQTVYHDPHTGEKRFIVKIKTRIRKIYQSTGIKIKIILSFAILSTVIITVLSYLNWTYQKKNINNLIKKTAEISIQTLNKSISEYILTGSPLEYQLLLKRFMEKPIEGLKEVALYDMVKGKKATSLSLDLKELEPAQIEKYKVFTPESQMQSTQENLTVSSPIVAFVAKEVKKKLTPEEIAKKRLIEKQEQEKAHADLNKQAIKKPLPKTKKLAPKTKIPTRKPEIKQPEYKTVIVQEEKYLGTLEFIFDRETLYSPIYKISATLFKISIYVLLAAIIGVLIFAAFLTKPISLLQKGVLNVTKGNLEFKIKIKSNDELGYLSRQFNEMVMSLKEKLEMQKFVSDGTIAAIKGKIRDNQAATNHREELSLLFSDIRGFTAMSETMEPEDIIHLLNSYFEDLSQIILRNGGDIDKYVGDEIFAIFKGQNKENNALKSAIEMQHAVDKINKENKTKIAIGIGINTGPAVLGSMGSSIRKDFTAIGDNVNIGARLCSNAAKGEIVVSETTYIKLKDFFEFEKKGDFSLKGKSQPVPIYRALIEHAKDNSENPDQAGFASRA